MGIFWKLILEDLVSCFKEKPGYGDGKGGEAQDLGIQKPGFTPIRMSILVDMPVTMLKVLSLHQAIFLQFGIFFCIALDMVLTLPIKLAASLLMYPFLA